MKVSVVIDRVRYQLGDGAAPVRWANPELFLWISDGQRAIVSLRPDAAYVDAVEIPASYDVDDVDDDLVVADSFADALVDYVCHKCLASSTEHADNDKRADDYKERFLEKVSYA